MRIGLFGGTFNPVHNGHIALATEALFRLKLNKVIFIPAYIPPHKDSSDIIDAEDRFNMLEAATDVNPAFEISRYEIDKKKKVYSIETVRHLKQAYPEDTEIFFLAGADLIVYIYLWKDLDELLTLSSFIVFCRPGFSRENHMRGIRVMDMHEVGISATQVRELIRSSGSVSSLVPVQVANYIDENNLYKQAR